MKLRKESSNPLRWVKKEVNRIMATTSAAPNPATACLELQNNCTGDGPGVRGEDSGSMREWFVNPDRPFQKAVRIPANPIAPTAMTNVSLVAYISPNPTPPRIAQ